MDEGEIRSYISDHQPRFEREQRRAFGLKRRQEIRLFVLANEKWTDEWVRRSVAAISATLAAEGLTRIRAFSWRSRPRGLGLTWDAHVDAGHDQAVERWLASDSSHLMWSSEGSETTVLANGGWRYPSGILYPPIPNWVMEPGDGDMIPVVLFFVWGKKLNPALLALDDAARAVVGQHPPEVAP